MALGFDCIFMVETHHIELKYRKGVAICSRNANDWVNKLSVVFLRIEVRRCTGDLSH
jgi:hypothetical protein